MKEITILNSKNQVLQSAYIYLGLDTEMLVTNGPKIYWPDTEGLPQERQPGAITTGGSYRFDFHGDGFATELCIKPDMCIERMMHYVAAGFKWWYGTKHSEPSMGFMAPSVYKIPKSVLDRAPDDMKKLGCMPSRNVHGDSAVPGNLAPFKRTTGCHLHLSHPVLAGENAIALAKNVVKWADILVGSTWTYISPEDSKIEAERRQFYGRAGEHRLKIYPTYPQTELTPEYSTGIEYRVLPGLVLQHPVYFSLMFNLYRSALHCATSEKEPDTELLQTAVEAINTANKDKAAEVLQKVPFDTASRDCLMGLQKSPLNPLTMAKWYALAMDNKGHRYYQYYKGTAYAL